MEGNHQPDNEIRHQRRMVSFVVSFGAFLCFSGFFIGLVLLVQRGVWNLQTADVLWVILGAVGISALFAFALTRILSPGDRSGNLASAGLKLYEQQAAQTPLAMLAIDSAGKVAFANEPAARLFDYDVATMAGLPAEYLIPDIGKDLRNLKQDANRSRSQILAPGKVVTSYGQRKGGAAIPLELWLSPLPVINEAGNEEKLLLCNLVDISQHQRAKDRLTRSLAIMQAAFDASNDAILVVDDQDKPIFFNQIFVEMWDFADSANQIEDPSTRHRKIAEKLVNSEDYLRSSVHRNLEANANEIRVILQTSSGKRIESRKETLQLMGTKVGCAWIYRDISENFQKDLALKQAEADTRHASGELARMVYELEQRAQEAILLNEMSDMMQLCTSREEAFQVVGRYVQQLIPETVMEGGGGILGVLVHKPAPLSGTETARVHSTNTQPIGAKVVRVATAWGCLIGQEDLFSSNACWALKRKRMHSEDGSQSVNLCQHVGLDQPVGYVCIPLIAEGEALGILTLVAGKGISQENQPVWMNRSRQNLVIALSERVSLSLSNLNLRESLREQAIQDSLTGLFNRRYMEMAMEREIRRTRRQDGTLSVIMVDIDHFKQFNDVFGHQAGDYVLREVANLLLHAVRLEDIVSRYGGEEFLMILPGSAGKDAARRGEHIRQQIEKLELEYEGSALGRLTLSIGIAELSDDHATPDDLIKVADEALYFAKATGRNRVYYQEGK